MTIDPTKQYQTRSGIRVRILCVDRKGFAQPVVGLYSLDEEGEEIIGNWSADGSWYSDGIKHDDRDLVQVPERRQLRCWLNIYDRVLPTTHDTKEHADKAHCSFNGERVERLACIEVNGEYTLGEGL